MHLAPKIDKYELVEELGHGGMATVYRAIDRRLGREVAVKVIHRHLRENQEVAARFVSEARAVAKLKHPNIVEVYDVSGSDEDENYLVVELVRGASLRELLREHRHLPAEIAAAIGIEVAAGLEHAHQHGVIHRDVKPENVLVEAPIPPPSAATEERTSFDSVLASVKITDFGIAKMLDQQGVTCTGQVLGSPAHMAPEQIEGGAVSARSDVFGLGVLLYEAMVGRLPFDGQNPAQVLRRVLDGAFAPADRCRPTVGAALSAIVGRALSHNAEDRFGSAWELAEALRAELGVVGFEDPRRELSAFLADPSGYRETYERQLVARLVELARKARAASRVPEAAALFNRALAFRPDDADLLGEVAGLARSRRMRRLAVRAVWFVSAASVLGAGAWLGLRALGSLNASHTGTRRTEAARVALAPKPNKPKLAARKPPASAQVARALAGASGPSRREPVTRARQSRGDKTQQAADAVKTAKVAVIITGATGGKLKIDGEPREWFGQEHALSPGPHTFEFIPPNDTCCVAPAPKTEIIQAQEAVQKVYGFIAFRDAVLRFVGQPGSALTCGELVAGTMPAGTDREVRMSKPQVRGICTVLPAATRGKPPVKIDVTLRPGETFTVTEP
ncbi:MAG: serine/threonine protein kinase [Polyangiaceae bacterium]|nr:serine/threonine protein kinase [Polyangiaceae bacterium]